MRNALSSFMGKAGEKCVASLPVKMQARLPRLMERALSFSTDARSECVRLRRGTRLRFSSQLGVALERLVNLLETGLGEDRQISGTSP